MSEWRIRVETPEGSADEESQLERFADSLSSNDDVEGVASTMDPQRGTLSATFHVEAANEQEAAWKGFWAYLHAVWAGEIVLVRDFRLEVQAETRGDDDMSDLRSATARFRGHLELERED